MEEDLIRPEVSLNNFFYTSMILKTEDLLYSPAHNTNCNGINRFMIKPNNFAAGTFFTFYLSLIL